LTDLTKIQALVLDDSRLVLSILREMLRSFGVRHIKEFTEAKPAIEFMRSNPVDIAFIDFVLQDEWSGFDVAENIRHDQTIVNPYMPIIMVTGHTFYSVVSNAINKGIDEVLAKPIRPKDVHARLQSLLSAPRTYIRTPDGYFGPERRRREDPVYRGPERRIVDEALILDQSMFEDGYDEKEKYKGDGLPFSNTKFIEI
jgi:two-component system chemotaxis response regulator CheY